MSHVNEETVCGGGGGGGGGCTIFCIQTEQAFLGNDIDFVNGLVF